MSGASQALLAAGMGPHQDSLTRVTAVRLEGNHELRMDDPLFRKKKLASLLRRKHRVVKRYSGGAVLYQTAKDDSGSTQTYFVEMGGDLYFISTYGPVRSSALPGLSVAQTAVWRDAYMPTDGEDTVRVVMVDRLLKQYGVLCSDALQTYDGAYLWHKFMTWALRHRLYVGVLDVPAKLVFRIDSPTVVDYAYREFWGTSYSYVSYRAVVSTRPFLTSAELTTKIKAHLVHRV